MTSVKLSQRRTPNRQNLLLWRLLVVLYRQLGLQIQHEEQLQQLQQLQQRQQQKQQQQQQQQLQQLLSPTIQEQQCTIISGRRQLQHVSTVTDDSLLRGKQRQQATFVVKLPGISLSTLQLIQKVRRSSSSSSSSSCSSELLRHNCLVWVDK